MHFTFYDVSDKDCVQAIFGTDVENPESFIKVLNAIGVRYEGKKYETKDLVYVAKDAGFVAVYLEQEK